MGCRERTSSTFPTQVNVIVNDVVQTSTAFLINDNISTSAVLAFSDSVLIDLDQYRSVRI